MGDQLYLGEDSRKFFQDELKLYKKTYIKKIIPVFENIEKESNNISHNYYNYMSSIACSEDVDGSDNAENALNKGIKYYENISLMKYNSLAMRIVMVYQYWEQQVRKFLYCEGYDIPKKKYQNFCNRGIDQIIKEFEKKNINITELKTWNKINELRLLCNTLKHGNGKAAIDLLKEYPKYFAFKEMENYNMLELYKSSLSEKVLNIENKDYSYFCENFILFWDELTEYI